MHLSNQRHPSIVLKSFTKLLSMSFHVNKDPLSLLSYQLWLSDVWAKSCQCNWMRNVTFYSSMSLVGRAWVFVTFKSAHHNCCLLLCVYVIGCDLLPELWPYVWLSQYMTTVRCCVYIIWCNYTRFGRKQLEASLHPHVLSRILCVLSFNRWCVAQTMPF